METPDSVASYVLGIDNGGYPESLEVRKLYAVLPDGRADENDYVRVIDETGEDYLYPSKYFVPPTATRSSEGSACRKCTTQPSRTVASNANG